MRYCLTHKAISWWIAWFFVFFLLLVIFFSSYFQILFWQRGGGLTTWKVTGNGILCCPANSNSNPTVLFATYCLQILERGHHEELKGRRRLSSLFVLVWIRTVGYLLHFAIPFVVVLSFNGFVMSLQHWYASNEKRNFFNVRLWRRTNDNGQLMDLKLKNELFWFWITRRDTRNCLMLFL